MTFTALHKWVTYVFACLGFAALALGTELGPMTVIVLVVGLVASWFAEGATIYAPAFARALTLAVFAALAVQILRVFAGAEILTVTLGYTGLLQISRLAHRRSATEHLHVVGLAFLHLLAGTLLSTGLDYAVVFLGFVVVAPWMLALTHLRAEIERQYTPDYDPAAAAGPPSPELLRMLGSKNLPSRGFLVGSSLLSLPLFVVTAAFFLVFPRVGLGLFTFGDARGEATAGFGNQVDLSNFGTIRDDPTVVARVFAGPPTEGGERSEGGGRAGSIRLRGTSFEHFDSVVWTRRPSPGERRASGYAPIALLPATRAARVRALAVRIVLTPIDQAVVFLPDGTFELRLASRIENGLEVPRPVLVRHGLDVRTLVVEPVDLEYVATIDPLATSVDEPLDASMREELLLVPIGIERVTALAEATVPTERDPGRIADAFVALLRDSGRYRYSLTSRDPRGENPLVHFMFTSRAGHCELYATALAVMLRARGIPARNVTGYLGGRWNRYGGYYAIQQGDAHSWVEAYIDGSFRVLDPTPAARSEVGPAPGLFAPLREWADALRMRWASDVVAYDMRRQLELVLALRDRLRGARGGHERNLEPIDEPRAPAGRSTFADMPLAMPLLAVLLGVVALVVFLRFRPTAKARVGAVERLYLDLDAALARRGFARPRDRTPLEHAAWLRRTGFAAIDAVEAITATYARARYAGESPDPATLRSLRRRLREIGEVERRASR